MLIGLLLLLPCSGARAGVYDLGEHPRAQAAGWPVVNAILELRAVSTPPPRGKESDPDSLRTAYLAQVKLLERLRKEGILSTLDSVNLAGAYIRLGNRREALNVLLAADQGHFLVQANLAGAYQSDNKWRQALFHQKKALALWPEVYAGLGGAKLGFSRLCEQYNLRLIEERLSEPPQSTPRLDSIFPGVRFFSPGDRNVAAVKEKGRAKDRQKVHHYFRGERGAKNTVTFGGSSYLAEPDGVIVRGMRFVAADGKYHAGQIDPEMADLLPREAIGIVVQLALWQPQDLRLCWLLGELLNATGDVEGAYRLLGPAEAGAARSWGGDERSKHRAVLEHALKAYRVLQPWEGRGRLLSQLLLITQPPGPLGCPGVGVVTDRLGTLGPRLATPQLDRPPLPSAPPNQGPVGTLYGSPPALPFNWRHVGASFVVGFLVAALLGFQVQQWRRRRPAPAFTEPVSQTGPAGKEAAGQPPGGTHDLDPGTAGTGAGWQTGDRSQGIRGVP
jgi:hypothetical protein